MRQLIAIVQLVDPRLDRTLWGETFQGGLGDVFAFQKSVAEAVARETLAELTVTDRSRLRRIQEVAPTVYEHYLRARFAINKRTSGDVRRGLESLQLALQDDPGYALAWAAVAECYAYLVSFGYAVLPPSEGIPKIKEAAQRALELDDSVSEAHTALALACLQNWEWVAAERAFLRALELSPSNADAHHKYAQFLSMQGRHTEAIEAMQQARRLDPLSVIVHQSVAGVFFMAGDEKRSIEAARMALDLSPDFWLAHFILAEIASRRGEHRAGGRAGAWARAGQAMLTAAASRPAARKAGVMGLSGIGTGCFERGRGRATRRSCRRGRRARRCRPSASGSATGTARS